MSEDDDKPRRPGKDTLLRERADKAEADEDRANDRAFAAIEARAASAEEAAKLWHRLTLALVAVLVIVIAGLLGVGVSGNIPGVGEISVSKATRSAPNVEAANEGAERDSEAGP